MKTYLDYEGIEVLAHRGGAEESYENTLESFEYSQSLGCKFIETDVQVSSDGIPYIFHDDDLKRICEIPKKFDSLKSDEIDSLTIFNNHKIIQKTNSTDRVCIASFSSKRLERVRSMSPNLCISMGPNEVFKTLLSRYKLINSPLKGDCLQVPMKYYGLKIVTKKFVEYLKSKDIKIMVWTINDVETFKYLIQLNVDGIITDKPKLLFDTLEKS